MPQRLLMHSSLWLLMRLGIAARFRTLGRLFGTWKGRFVLLLILGGIGVWMFGSLVNTGVGLAGSPETVRSGGALGLAVMFVTTILFSGSEGGGVAFKPAEVEFLFPSPIPRRQLMIFRIVSVCLMTFPTSFFIAVSFQRHSPTLLGSWLGVWLSFCLLSLLQMAWQLISGIAEQNTVARSRKGLLILLVILVVVAFATGSLGSNLSISSVTDFAKSPLGQKVLLPFLPFTSVMTAANYGDLLKWVGVSVSILLGFVFVILRLDINHTEASLAASQRMATRVADARRGRVAFNKGNTFLKRFSVPQLPRLGGAGPIAWHQLTALLRSAGNLGIFLLILGGALMAPLVMSGSVVVKQVLILMGTMSVLLLPQFIQYDFRSEIDRMAVLKALPLSPLAVCCGELLAPILATLVVQFILLGLIVLIGAADVTILVYVAVFLLPVDMLIYAVENFVFLLFPFRMGPTNGQDLQNMLRVMLTMMVKMLLLGSCAGIALGFGALCYFVTEQWSLSIAVGWVTTLACSAAVLPALAWAFHRFDPASDTPG